MNTISKLMVMLLLVGVQTTSCKKPSNANDENEHEAINKVMLTFSRAGAPNLVFLAEDPDGDGGLPPSRIDTIRLAGGQTYTTEIRFINIVNGLEKDLTPQIVAQGRSHEVFYIPASVQLTVTKTDRDLSGFPIGVSTTWQTGPPAIGSVLIKLMHKTGIKGPADSPNVGHSDIQLSMPIRYQ
ncbi:MAG: hypothetical protein ACKOA3_02475 [Sphingomonadales bacterium]